MYKLYLNVTLPVRQADFVGAPAELRHKRQVCGFTQTKEKDGDGMRCAGKRPETE